MTWVDFPDPSIPSKTINKPEGKPDFSNVGGGSAKVLVMDEIVPEGEKDGRSIKKPVFEICRKALPENWPGFFPDQPSFIRIRSES